jgi:hypothetical protein
MLQAAIFTLIEELLPVGAASRVQMDATELGNSTP